MRHFHFLIALLVAGSLFSCDDGGKKNNNSNNNNNNNTCACGISIESVNGYEPGQIPALVAADEDRNPDMPGFQVEVIARVAETGFSCVPPDGAQVTLMGGVAEAAASLSGHRAVFSDYTIPSGAGTIQLYARVPDCQSERVPVQLSTGAVPECRIESGVENGAEYACPADDQAANQLGLQRVVRVRCVDVPAGTPVVILVDGNEQGTENLTASNTAEFAVTLPVTAICRDHVTVTARVQLPESVLEDSVTTGQACCEGAVPCSLRWTAGVDYAEGAPAGLHALNMSTDGDAGAPGHQSTFEITTRSDAAARVRILAHNGDGNWALLCEQASVSANTFSLPCTVPDGTAYLKPVCTTRADGIDFEDASQAHHVITDTVAPPAFENFACTVTNAHEVDITCTWDIPASGEAIGDTQARYTANYDETQCLADAGGLFASAWSTLPITPGYVFPLGAGAPGDARQFVFSPFVPGPGYCLGIRPVDPAGNPGPAFSTAWSGVISPDSQTIAGYVNNSQFGSSIAGVDLNCDGLRDLVVGSVHGPCVHNPANFCYGDGQVFIYFARPGQAFSSTPDVTLKLDDSVPDIGGGTWIFFGNAVAGLGNFTGHFDSATDSSQCEDLAVGAPWMYFYDETYSMDIWPGAVYVLKGRPVWNASVFTTADDDPNGFDLVLPYLRADGNYTDNISFFEEFGTAVAPIGDFDGDGVGDMAVSAPNAMPGGAVYVYRGQPVPFKNGVNSPVIWNPVDDAYFTVLGNSIIGASNLADAHYEWLGKSLSALGDIDRDGKDDFIVGAPGCGGSMVSYGSQPGKALLVLGGNAGAVSLASPDGRLFSVESSTGVPGTECMGYSVAGIGDFNADGFLDFAVGDPRYNIPATSDYREGAVFVFFGRAVLQNLTTEESSMRIRSEWLLTDSDDSFGISIGKSVQGMNSLIGDYNNDGIPELLIGAKKFGANHGSAFIWLGSASYQNNPDWRNYETATFWFVPPSSKGYWGDQVAWMGDVNGDGYSDFCVGDYAWDGLYGGTASNPYRGRVTIFY